MFDMPWLSVSSISIARWVGDQYIKYNTVPNHLVSHPKPLRDSPGPRQKRVLGAYGTRVKYKVITVSSIFPELLTINCLKLVQNKL